MHARDSFGNFITSCSTKDAFDDKCLVEIGQTVRFFVHNGALNSTSQTGMGQNHEEITFELYDPMEILVLSGRAPFDDDSICLERGVHQLKMTDSFGDGFHDNMAVTEDLSTGNRIATCGITSNSFFPVYQAECSVPVKSCTEVHLDVETNDHFEVLREDNSVLLSGRGSFSEIICLECGSYAVRTDSLSEVSWTQVVDDDSLVRSAFEYQLYKLSFISQEKKHTHTHTHTHTHRYSHSVTARWSVMLKSGRI